jgi:hypothetical protein
MREKCGSRVEGDFDAVPCTEVDRAVLAVEEDAGGDRGHRVVTGERG